MTVVIRQWSVVSRTIGYSLSTILFVLLSSAEAQHTGKIYRVGYLSGSFPDSSLAVHSVKRELHNRGYIEGKNIAFEYRHAEDKPERTPTLAEELVRLKVDVIIAAGSSDTRAAKNATRTIPIVFLESVSDPVALGLVASLANPGGNVTGFTTIATVLAGKRLEVLREAIPTLSSVAVLWNSQTPETRRNCNKANASHLKWVCNFIRWTCAVPINTKVLLQKQSRRAAGRLL